MSRWQKRFYLSQPAPRILHLPSRYVRRTARPGKVDMRGGSGKERLATLFEREWRFRISSEGCVLVEEVLRAECNVLRMEREIVVKKLRRSRSSAEKILRTTIQALVDEEDRGRSGHSVLNRGGDREPRRETRRVEEEDKEEGGGSCIILDTQAAVLQKRLEKLHGVGFQNNPSKEIMSSQCEGEDEDSGDCKVELLRRKMEGLSKDVLLEKMIQEYGSILSSSKRIKWQLPRPLLATGESSQNIVSSAKNVFSDHCKVVVHRVIEQVRSEMEQWSQIQTMLGQLRGEMGELQVSRDFWEDLALDNDHRIRSLSSAAREWRRKTIQSATKVTELQGVVVKLREEVERLRNEEKGRPESSRQMVQGETEICHLRRRQKENPMEQRRKVRATDVNVDGSSRYPFKDIGNLTRQSVKNASSP